MEQNEMVAKNEDEISLIDLLVVLLRRRWIVIWMTAASIVGALGIFYLAPAIGLRPKESFSVNASLYPTPIPSSIRGDIGIDIASYALSLATDSAFIADIVWDSGLYETRQASDARDPRFLAYLENGFIGKDYKVELVKGILDISLKGKDKEKAERFVRRITARVDAELRRIVAERSKIIYATSKALVGDIGDDSQYLSDSIKADLVSSQTYASGEIALLSELSEIVVLSERKGRASSCAVVVLAGFFFGILAAFCVDAIAAVKSDKESMGKIRGALDSGRKPR
jgi:hypothetical protein